MDVRLYMFDGSNACLTAQLALAAAGIEYRAVQLPPGAHAIAVRALGFRGQTVPALQIYGRKILGSKAICHAVAELRPESGLLPDDPQLRAAIEHAEERGERFQNALRRLMYVSASYDRTPVRALLEGTAYGRLPSPLVGLATRGIVKAATAAHNAKPERALADIDLVIDVIAEVDQLVRDGIMGGEVPNVADCQLAPNISGLALIDHDGRLGIREHPAWQVAERLVPRYPLDTTLNVPEPWIARMQAGLAPR
ncbi:MAG: glutathione S-transferase family protein [Thermoleophilia bacterium]|nr:glutathione S-transferase family protein [Thermoleophilia bacterium]